MLLAFFVSLFAMFHTGSPSAAPVHAVTVHAAAHGMRPAAPPISAHALAG